MAYNSMTSPRKKEKIFLWLATHRAKQHQKNDTSNLLHQASTSAVLECIKGKAPAIKSMMRRGLFFA